MVVHANGAAFVGEMVYLAQHLAADWGRVVAGVCKSLIINKSLKWHGHC